MNDKDKRFYPKRVLLVVSTGVEYRGGVELLEDSLTDLMSRNNINFLSVLKTEIIAKALPGDLILIQEEGRLSRPDRLTIETLLDMGCYIGEKNVFALASRFRPSHPNYFLIFMSNDGLNRFVLREFLQYKKFKGRILILPNLHFYPQSPENHEKKDEILSMDSELIRIIRVGRPDWRKYTNFEVQFCKKIALQLPNARIELSRVGVPPEIIKISDIPSNLIVKDLGYVSDLSSLYSEADVYLQYSRIGETFGHTFFEAYDFGLAIIGCFDLHYDTAPIEYLNSFAYFASRKSALNNPLQTLQVSFDKKNASRDLSIDFERENLDFLSGEISKLERTRPNIFQAVKYFYQTGKILKVSKRYFVLCLLMEILSTHYFRFVIWVGENSKHRDA
jgi:hypothetical protein